MALSMIYVVIEQMSLAVGSAVTVAMCIMYNPTPCSSCYGPEYDLCGY